MLAEGFRRRSAARRRARRSISPSSACCSTPAPDRMALSRRRDRRGIGRSEGLGARQPRHVRARRFFLVATPQRRSAARRRRRSARSSTPRRWSRAFRSTHDNPLVGLEGRAELLRALGRLARGAAGSVRAATTRRGPAAFSIISPPRPRTARSPAPLILSELLQQFGPIWPSRLDARRRAARRLLAASRDGHRRRHQRTRAAAQALAMARLFADRAAAASRLHRDRHRRAHRPCRIPQRRPVRRYRRAGAARPGRRRARARRSTPRSSSSGARSPWRCSTGSRSRCAPSSTRAPPRCRSPRCLQGGTWAAGRELAFARRADGSPPIKVISDGTVF